MADKIEPALTPKAWALILADGEEPRRMYLDYHASRNEHAAVIALENHALPDSDLRKITRRKLDDIREAARTQLAALSRTAEDVVAKRIMDFADALESYLPPGT